MASIPTNQNRRNLACAGIATESGVYMGGRRVAPKQGNYTGGVVVVRLQSGVNAVIRTPGMIASNS